MKRIFRNKTVLILTAVVLTAATILASVRKPSGVYAASFKSDTAYSVTDIHNVFPQSYWAGLEALKANHPNWKFVAFHTTLNFDRCMASDAEMYPTRNLVYSGSTVYGLDYPITTSWYSTTVDGSYNWAGNRWNALESGNWYQASEEAVRYCMDPRNFLDETQIFQFLDGCSAISDPTISRNAVDAVIRRVGSGVSHWLKSGEELDLYYEEVVPNPAYAEYLERQAALQSSIAASIEESIQESIQESIRESVEASIAAENPDASSDGESSDAEPEESAETSESNPPDTPEPEPAPPETLTVRHYLTYPEAIQRISDELGLNAAMVASRIMQEHGSGTSPLISGTKPFTVVNSDGTTTTIPGGYYNYFNIQASGSNYDEIVTNGLREAYNGGWNTRYKALYGGAAKYKNLYISRGQTTFYLQKFNVIVTEDPSLSRLFWGQYMQNLTAPQTECRMLKNSLESANALDADYTFLIPIYGNMPSSSPRPTKDGNPNWKLGGIYVNGISVPNFSMDKLSYGAVISEKQLNSVQIISYASTTNLRVTKTYDGVTGEVTFRKEAYEQTSGGVIQTLGSHSADVYLEVGDTVFTVLSTAENGDSSTYTFTVHVNEPAPPETEESSEEDPSEESTEAPSGSETGSSGESGTEASSEEPPAPVLYGDVNDDGVWNIKDITMIGAYILKDIQFSSEVFNRADINGDGKVNIQDITYIGAYILRDIQTVPQR